MMQAFVSRELAGGGAGGDAAPAARDEAADRRYPWVAMAVVLTGTFMVILDTTIVNVALPEIGEALTATNQIEWVVTAYLLAVGLSQLGTGWFSDRFGKKRAFIASLIVFTAGSLLCAAAPSLWWLVAARIVQGFGGGAMMPVGLAMIYELFPAERRGTALGVWGIAAMAAPALGPVLGGGIATGASWHWLFLVNVPVGVIGTAAAVLVLRDQGFRQPRPLAWKNYALAAVGLAAFLLALDRAGALGWSSPLVIGGLVGGLAVIGLFIVAELRSPSPLIEVRMFAVGTFSLTIVLVWLVTGAQFARLVFIPLELQQVRGLTPFETGLVLSPAALGAAVTMPLGGRLADRIGARVPVTAGLLLLGVSQLMLGTISLDTSLQQITTALVIGGAGTGLVLMPSNVAGLNALPGELISRAAAVRSLNRQIAGAFGVAVLSTVVAGRIGGLGGTGVDAATLQAAYNLPFLIALVALVVAIPLGLRLPNQARTRELQEERGREARELAGAGRAS